MIGVDSCPFLARIGLLCDRTRGLKRPSELPSREHPVAIAIREHEAGPQLLLKRIQAWRWKPRLLRRCRIWSRPLERLLLSAYRRVPSAFVLLIDERLQRVKVAMILMRTTV